MPQSFNDMFMGNANVPRSGGQDVQTVTSPSGAGKPANGTDSPRVTVQTLQAGINSTPSGGKNQCPAQSFEDGEI